MQYINEILIGTSVENVLDALANPAKSKEYYYGFEIYSDFQPGSKYEYRIGDNICIEGIIKEIVAGSKIVMTFNGKWSPNVANHPESEVIWEVEQIGDNTFLRLTHNGLIEGTYNAEHLPRGWVNIISSLKTYLETGKPLNIDLSLMMNN